jgi:hypothetical protein
MFRKLASLLTVKGGETFGFLLHRELDDCGKDIMAAFGVSYFYRDYEDKWEWLEGDATGGLHVNVSRPHNWKSGEYELPVVVRVSGPIERLTTEFLSHCAQSLANRLQTEVWIGNVITDENRHGHYTFDVEQRFAPTG